MHLPSFISERESVDPPAASRLSVSTPASRCMDVELLELGNGYADLRKLIHFWTATPKPRCERYSIGRINAYIAILRNCLPIQHDNLICLRLWHHQEILPGQEPFPLAAFARLSVKKRVRHHRSQGHLGIQSVQYSKYRVKNGLQLSATS